MPCPHISPSRRGCIIRGGRQRWRGTHPPGRPSLTDHLQSHPPQPPQRRGVCVRCCHLTPSAGTRPHGHARRFVSFRCWTEVCERLASRGVLALLFFYPPGVEGGHRAPPTFLLPPSPGWPRRTPRPEAASPATHRRRWRACAKACCALCLLPACLHTSTPFISSQSHAGRQAVGCAPRRGPFSSRSRPSPPPHHHGFRP